MSMKKYSIGKVNREIFENVILPNLGKKDPSIIVGPRFGVDFSVIDLGEKVLIVEVDPVFVVPEYGWERSAWFAVHILASDVAVSGVPPRYLFIDLNLPLKMTDEEFKILWTRIHAECEKLGIAIAAGHTGRYGGVDYPMIGGAMFPKVIVEAYGEGFVEKAQNIFWLQTVVPDALTLAKIGLRTGVTAMHDATEYGVWGALYDIAKASGVGIRVYEDKLFIRDDVLKVINVFSKFTGIEVDPYAAISEGTLIATVKPDKADLAIKLLGNKGIDASVIGEVIEDDNIVLVRKNEEEVEVPLPSQDPFWLLFFKTLDILRSRGGNE